MFIPWYGIILGSIYFYYVMYTRDKRIKELEDKLKERLYE